MIASTQLVQLMRPSPPAELSQLPFCLLGRGMPAREGL